MGADHEAVLHDTVLEGRAHARRLKRAGVKAAGQYAEKLVLIAGMLGVPTSAEDGLLLVAILAGGDLLVEWWV